MKGLKALLRGLVLSLIPAVAAWSTVGLSSASALQGKGCLPLSGPAYTAVAYFQLLNTELAALLSTNSGVQPPGSCDGGPPAFGQTWLDTSASVPWLRMWSGDKWLGVAAIDVGSDIWEPPIGGGIATLAAASVTDLCATPESSISIIGNSTIASFGTSCAVGQVKLVSFAGVLALTHSPVGIILPGGVPIVTQVGDSVAMNYVGGGVWRAYGYQRADGTPLVPSHYAGQSITMRGTSCPAGSLPEDGRSLAKSVYPQLTAAIGTAWGGTDTTFNLPDTRGNFERGWGSGQSVDAGRVFGALQNWAVGDHTHPVNIGVASNFSSGFSAAFNVGYRYIQPNITNGVSGQSYGRVADYGYVNENATGTVSGTVSGTAYGTVSGNTGGASGGASENRTRNITAFHCIFTSTF